VKTREIKLLKTIDVGKKGKVLTTLLKGAEHLVAHGVAEFTDTPLQKVAREYFEQGNNIVPISFTWNEDKKEWDKKPLGEWQKWIMKRQTHEEFEALPLKKAEGYAIICGRKLKNGMYIGVVDIDTKKTTENAVLLGKRLEKSLRITHTERSIQNGKHFVYYSRRPIKTMNSAHGFCGCEVLGKKKLCIMAPSKGYKKVNDNGPTEIEGLNELFNKSLKIIGYKNPKVKIRSYARQHPEGTIRPCVLELQKRDHLEHFEKVLVVTEYKNAGFSQEKIEQLFIDNNAWEGTNYNQKTTLYQISDILKRKYNFPCVIFENKGLCVEDCTIKTKIAIEDCFDLEGGFNPVLFAKHLMGDYRFKTMRDNETIYIYNEGNGIYEKWGDTFIKEQMVNKLEEQTRKRYYEDIVFYIRGATYFDREHNPLGVIAVNNGYLNVVTHKIEDFSPDQFITTKIPVTYDPSAKCPKILIFIEEVIGFDQLEALQEFIGYCLYKAMLFHKALMLVGLGSNGKSTLQNLIEKLLGKENVNHATLHALCYSRFASAQLYGKLANMHSDISGNALEITGALKTLTGNDTINAQEKFKKEFGFRNHAKFIFSANRVPDTTDDTLAFFRRWLIIECNNIFLGKNKNPYILKEITTPTELSGFLNWALEGLKRLLENGGFSISETMEDMKRGYIKHSNSAKAFIEECLTYKEYKEYDKADKTTHEACKNYIIMDELYNAFLGYCKKNKLRTMRKAVLTVNMQQYMYGAQKTQIRLGGKKSKQIRVWKNVTPVTPTLFNSLPTPNIPQKTGQKTLINDKKSKEEIEKGDKQGVTGVTPEDPTTCHICNLALLSQQELVEFEGKTTHKHCAEDTVKGRKEGS